MSSTLEQPLLHETPAQQLPLCPPRAAHLFLLVSGILGIAAGAARAWSSSPTQALEVASPATVLTVVLTFFEPEFAPWRTLSAAAGETCCNTASRINAVIGHVQLCNVHRNNLAHRANHTHMAHPCNVYTTC